MAEQCSEKIEVLGGTGDVTITLDAPRGDATVGGNGKVGDVRLFASAGAGRRWSVSDRAGRASRSEIFSRQDPRRCQPRSSGRAAARASCSGA